jgi:hypothetical protein
VTGVPCAAQDQIRGRLQRLIARRAGASADAMGDVRQLLGDWRALRGVLRWTLRRSIAVERTANHLRRSEP